MMPVSCLRAFSTVAPNGGSLPSASLTIAIASRRQSLQTCGSRWPLGQRGLHHGTRRLDVVAQAVEIDAGLVAVVAIYIRHHRLAVTVGQHRTAVATYRHTGDAFGIEQQARPARRVDAVQHRPFRRHRQAALRADADGAVAAGLVAGVGVDLRHVALMAVITAGRRSAACGAGADLIVVVFIDPVVVPDPVSVLFAIERHVVTERACTAPGQRQRQIHPVVVALVVTVAIGRQRHADVLEIADVEVARYHQVVTIVRRPIPVGLVAVVEIGAQPQFAELLVEGDGVHLPLPLRPFVTRIQVVPMLMKSSWEKR